MIHSGTDSLLVLWAHAGGSRFEFVAWGHACWRWLAGADLLTFVSCSCFVLIVRIITY